MDSAERLIDFLVEVFGGVEQGRSLGPDGRIEHGDVRIGDSLVMLRGQRGVGSAAGFSKRPKRLVLRLRGALTPRFPRLRHLQRRKRLWGGSTVCPFFFPNPKETGPKTLGRMA